MEHRMKIREDLDTTITIPNTGQMQESAGKQKDLPDRIVTVVEAIHSGLTRNFTFYPADNLERSVESWTRDYNKPVIKNHDIYEEPVGRVLSAFYKQSQFAPDKHTIELELEITDPEAIKKVMDGRYQTLSIGGSTNSAICSICGKDLVKENYCGHMKGRTYEGKQAHWIIGEMNFDEISWVNAPADRNAKVVQKNTVQTKESVSTEGGASMPTENTDILDQIDNIRQAEGTGEPTPTDPANQTEGTEPEGTNVQEGTEPTEPTTPVTESADVTLLTEQVATLSTENTALVAERDTLTTQLSEMTAERDTLQTQATTLQDNLNIADGENKNLMKQNVTLATYAHRALAEGVASLQIVLGKAEIEQKEELIATLCKETSRALKDQMTALLAEKPQRQVQTVSSPGIVSTNEEDESAAGKGKQEEQAQPTIVDLAEKLTQAFTKNLSK